jgi:hypothetical protein
MLGVVCTADHLRTSVPSNVGGFLLRCNIKFESFADRLFFSTGGNELD